MPKKKHLRVLSFIQDLDPAFLPLVTAKNLLEAAIPYLNLLLPAFIINLLYQQAPAEKILGFVAVYFLLFLGIRLLFQFLKEKLENHHNLLMNLYALRKVEKVFSVKFDLLETSSFEKTMQGIRYNDENFGAFRNYMEELGNILRNLFQILAALAIFAWMAQNISKTESAGGILLVICILLTAILLSAAVMMKIQKAVNARMPALMDKLVDLNTIFMTLYEDVVQNYQRGKDVRLFRIDRLIIREGEKMIRGFTPHIKKQIWLSQSAGMAGSVFSLLLGGISFAVMGSYALSGSMAPGNVISFAGSIQQLSSAVIGIAFSLGNLNLWNVRMDAAFELFDLEEEKTGRSFEPLRSLSEITFQNVSFRYPEGNADILKNISLTIKKGEKIAVVGPNGSGKTTFIKLLTGLYEPAQGQILINGQRIDQMNPEARRSCFAAVYQDFTLFSFPLGENIALDTDWQPDKITQVLTRLKLMEKVRRMPKGPDTYLYQDYGEDGVEPSGGEAQKLAICRALYQDAPFVVLDEPTAALDPVSEYEIYKDFQMLVEDKTAVFVSHRLSSCRFCQKIFVFENGQIVQQGNHEALLQETDGLYRRLWDMQARYYVQEEPA